MTPHRRWHSDKTKDGTEYHLVDSNIDAGVWKENGHWKMSFALDAGANYYQADLGKTRFVRKALNRAEITIMDAQVQIHQSYRDVQNVVNLAKETEDRTPEEQASIDRLEESLIMGRPDFPDPSDDWLNTFQAEMREREDPIAQQPEVAAALEASDAHRTAKALLDAYFDAETRANTPVYEDSYPDVDTQTPYAAFQDHLREHPELEVLDEWKVYFQELQKDRDQDKGYEF